ncbi:hypothetical protein V501_05492 [Pseudogymnoascus sp. VKM F-4519 (FW-2642)]|nr:hypothetical protein V501_05492 [Pseudogymnoascus sp. VKM F-4519 (FW-2642)]
MGRQPGRASSTAPNAGPPRQLRSTSQTKPKSGQQICKNYILGRPCHKSPNCRYFHDEEARINWENLKQDEKKVGSQEHKALMMSDTAKPTPSSLTVPSKAGTISPKQILTKSTVSQTASTSDTSPSMPSTATTPLTDYVHPHLRKSSSGSSNASQPSSIDSAAGKLSFNEWNQHRAVLAASFTPRLAGSTAMVGQDHLDGVLKYKTDMLTSSIGIVPLREQHAKLLAAAKENSQAFIGRLPVDVTKNIDRIAGGIAATAGFLPFEAGAGVKPEGITDEMWAFMGERDVKNMSISTNSSKRSRASRKSINITAKVMGFIHRRVNTADTPTPLGVGHPAYDSGSEKPRVCLPNLGNRQVSPNKPRSPLDQVQPALGLGIIHEAPLSNLPNAPRKDPVVFKYQSPQAAAVRDNSAHINAWLNAAKFIAADDKALEEENIIRAKEASSQSRVEIVSKFVPRQATVTNSSYGEAVSGVRLLSRRAFPIADGVAVSKPLNELIEDAQTMTVAKTSISSENSSNGDLQSNSDDVQSNFCHQVPKESVNYGQTAMAKAGPMKAELCINYIRGFPCYYGNECDRYHDEKIRNAAMMNPCMEYNSGQLCHNRKFCTLYHDVAPMNAPRCLEFALGHECPRMPTCTLYHDTVFRNATRFANDICFNFLLGLPCHAEMCKYRHDIDLRDTLNGVRSYRSMPFMDGACSNKIEASNSENHRHIQERPNVLAPITTTIPIAISTAAPLCFNYLFGMRCSAGTNNCKFKHEEGLRAQVMKNTCRKFAVGYTCMAGRECRFYHDVKFRDTLREYKLRQVSAQEISKVDAKGLPHGTQKYTQETKKPSNLAEKKVVARTASIEPTSPAKSEGAAAWGDFAAHIATGDADAATRARTNSSGGSQTSLITVFRDRADNAVNSTAPKDTKSGNTSMVPGKKSGSTSRVLSITSRDSSNTKPIAAKEVIESGSSNISQPFVNNTRCNSKLTRYCPRFHGGRYHCENRDKCDFVHDPKLQQIYKSKDPRFQSTKPPRHGAKTSQWAKNSYDCGAWSLTIVPMAPLAKAKGKFVRFPLLPAEIRLKIWGFCLTLPYSPIVHQHFKNVRSTKPTAKYVCFTRHPPLLDTCTESRAEALKYFSLGLGTVTSPPRTYINYEASSVYLCTRRSGYFIPMMQSLLPVDLANIQSLTLKLRDWLINDDCVFRDAIWKFTNLKRLTMLISTRDEDEEFRTPVAKDVLMSALAWQADELNPGFRMPLIHIMVLDGLEIDSDPEEYAPPATRGERIADHFHELQIQALFSSAV